jgi:hypothetical protein
MVITKFEKDRDELREDLEKDVDFKLYNDEMTDYRIYEDVHQILELLSSIKEDMLNTFDA